MTNYFTKGIVAKFAMGGAAPKIDVEEELKGFLENYETIAANAENSGNEQIMALVDQLGQCAEAATQGNQKAVQAFGQIIQQEGVMDVLHQLAGVQSNKKGGTMVDYLNMLKCGGGMPDCNCKGGSIKKAEQGTTAPEKKPGILSRLFGKSTPTIMTKPALEVPARVYVNEAGYPFGNQSAAPGSGDTPYTKVYGAIDNDGNVQWIQNISDETGAYNQVTVNEGRPTRMQKQVGPDGKVIYVPIK